MENTTVSMGTVDILYIIRMIACVERNVIMQYLRTYWLETNF